MYKIELWGAQGGTSASYIGGYGAYAVGERNLTKGDIFEFAVGGKGQDGYAGSGLLNGGYNGGGATKLGNDTGYGQKNSPGGGATHIAFKIDNEKELLVDYINNKDQIIIVAGGGGGAHYCKDGISEGGHGGGVIGTSPKSIFQVSASNCAHYIPVGGGTQTEGGVLGTSGIVASSGSFGKGGNYTTGNWGAGGGAGWYGGSSGNYGPGCVYGGAGGSSYINANELNNAEMYCYNCMESTIASENTISTTGNREEADKVNCPNGYSSDPISKCAKSGNGHLRITLIG